MSRTCGVFRTPEYGNSPSISRDSQFFKENTVEREILAGMQEVGTKSHRKGVSLKITHNFPGWRVLPGKCRSEVFLPFCKKQYQGLRFTHGVTDIAYRFIEGKLVRTIVAFRNMGL